MNGTTLAARIALVGVFLAAAKPALAGTDYVQLSSSLPKPVPRSAAAPSHLLAPVPEARSNGAWDEIGLGAGVSAALVALFAASGRVFTRLFRKEHWR